MWCDWNVYTILTGWMILLGSGENHQAYFYKRINTPAKPKAADTKIVLPARAGFDEEAVEVVCDPCFAETVAMAVGGVDALKTRIAATVMEHMNQARPKRERKPRVL